MPIIYQGDVFSLHYVMKISLLVNNEPFKISWIISFQYGIYFVFFIKIYQLFVYQALNLLESGDLAVLSFGEKPNLLHPFTEQFSEHSGAKILEQLRFEQTKTKIAQLLDFCTVMFDQQSIRSDALNAKLLVIVSDGRGIFSEGETRVLQSVRRARQQGIFLVYVIIDNPDNKVSD